MYKNLKFISVCMLILSITFFPLPASVSSDTGISPIAIEREYPGEDAFDEDHSSKKGVKQLEWLLFEAGYLGKMDGKFTNKDQQAVQAFQDEMVKKADIEKELKEEIEQEKKGIPGLTSWELLVDISNGAYPTERSYVKWKSKMPIYRMEKLLHGVGMLDKKHVNGKLTKADMEACQKYQISKKDWTKETAWGIPGPKTWDYLIEDYMEKHPLPDFKVGETSDQVKTLRKLLKAAGYKSDSSGNQFTSRDQETVQKFQQAQGLEEEQAEGLPDEKTWVYLHIGSLGVNELTSKQEEPKSTSSNTNSNSSSTDKCAPARERGYQVIKVVTVTATAYGTDGNGIWGPIDSLGNPLHSGVGLNQRQNANRDFRTIAVDPSVITKPSKVYVTGYKTMGLSIPKGGFIGKATDVGGAIKGNRIDIFVNTTERKVAAFGVQPGVTVCVLKK